MTLFEFVGAVGGGIVLLYTAARLIFLAYFITKQQHERKQRYGTQQKPR